MILDNYQHLDKYSTIYPQLKEVMPFIERAKKDNLPLGTYEIDGKQVYAIIQQYRTDFPEKLLWEYHEKYVDMHYILEGTEKIGWIDHKCLTDCSEYSKESDSVISYCRCTADAFTLTADQFVIFAPYEAHKPRCTHPSSEEVKKIVIKIALPEKDGLPNH